MVQVLNKIKAKQKPKAKQDNSEYIRLYNASYGLQSYLPEFSAANLFSGTAKTNLIKGLMFFALAFMFNAQMSFAVIFIALNILFFASISFKLIAFIAGLGKQEEQNIKITKFPVYSILIPLYKEANTLQDLIDAMEALNYPKAKLDVKLVIEADDFITIDAIAALELPRYFEVIKTPFSMPRTKPKACNYALNFVRGKFVTIYDAEDVPHPDQIREVLHKFENSEDDLVCIQARLNYFNYDENQLTRWFALEYATWFDLVMRGFERLGFTIPLGGTSNHIKTKALNEAGGWDAFNVTEDCDLGFRLIRMGYRTETINSITMEEAVNNLDGWFKQRTRWIKGFLQTYIVHMRKPGELIRNGGFKSFLTLQLFIGAPAVIFVSALPLLVASQFFEVTNEMYNISIFNLFYGIAAHMVLCFWVNAKSKIAEEKLFKTDLLFSCITFPFYSILHIYSAYRAFYQLIKAPFLWEKTTHGVTKIKRGAL